MALTRTTKNICLKLSETWKLSVIFTDANGAALDLTGRTVKVQVRTTADAASATLSLTTASGGGLETSDLPNGIVTINTETTDITEPFEGVWALELSGSENEEPVSGVFSVIQDIVR